MSAYQEGFTRGAREAREVLCLPLPRPLWGRATVHDLPAGVMERADWLNGYAAGIRHVAFNVATGTSLELVLRGGGDHGKAV